MFQINRNNLKQRKKIMRSIYGPFGLHGSSEFGYIFFLVPDYRAKDPFVSEHPLALTNTTLSQYFKDSLEEDSTQ